MSHEERSVVSSIVRSLRFPHPVGPVRLGGCARFPRAPRLVAASGILGFAGLLGLTGVAFVSSPAAAVYTTPGTGASYTLDDLVGLSGGAVTGASPDFEFHDSVVISTSDVLSIGAGTQVSFLDTAGALRLEIRGSLLAHGAEGDSIRFSSPTETPGDWDGLDFRDTATGSTFEMRYCVVEDATIAIDVVSADVDLDHCALRGSSEKAFDLTSSNSVLRNSILEDNEKQTVYMTLSSSPLLENNLLRRNNLLNASPYPYVNIGLQGVNSPTIRGNTILGGESFRSGGISIWNECHGLIEGNRIEGCGYGILCYQFDADPRIHDNDIVDNNTNPDTVNWGFGIACNGANAPVISGNRIGGHYYGVAIINGAQPNVGDVGNADPNDDGRNQFLGNGLGEAMYELYNNGALDIKAENNWWGTTDPQEIEDRIVHSVDDPLLGTVDFDPFLDVVAVEEGQGGSGHGGPGPADAGDSGILMSLRASPNPVRSRTDLTFRLAETGPVTVRVFDSEGRLVREIFRGILPSGRQEISWDGEDAGRRAVSDGVYFWRVVSGAEAVGGKLTVVR